MASPDDKRQLVESPQVSPTISKSSSQAENVPSIIPPEHPYRTLVLCFDGTGDQFDSDNSNIVEFFTMLKKDDRHKQLVYYQAGIGTYTTPQVATPFLSKLSKMVDVAIAKSLHSHVMGGYEFLMQNYIVGDRICIFGFSRGAYTARSLAGMIHKVGILPACNHQQVPFAYKMYTRADELGWAQSNAFKKAFSVHADIEFIGVWDTVNSVGLLPKRLPFTTSNTIVRTFRHAVSLDERRAKFKANLWNRPNPTEQCLGEDDHFHKLAGDHVHTHDDTKKGRQRTFERKYSKDQTAPTDIEEVWFAGCHCDVGGGSVANTVKTSLARIPLRWMIRECFKTNTGIMFHADLLREAGLDPASLWPEVSPRPPALPVKPEHRIRAIPRSISTKKVEKEIISQSLRERNLGTLQVSVRPSEEERELQDALSPVYDQLNLQRTWWILEFLPLKQKRQRSNDSWTGWYSWNMARPRIIPRQKAVGVKVHRSVKMRMEALHEDGSKYKPRATFDLAHTTWVD